MQTRAEFIAHGLAPVPDTTLSTLTGIDFDCTICSEELSDPVQLPCRHIFDKKCISQWLQMPGKNTCPSCRNVLFSMPFAEPTNPVADRTQTIYRALRDAGLSVDQPGNIERFSIAQPSQSAMARAAPAAAQYLIFSSAPNQAHNEAGPARINANHLAAHVITMGNLLPALAAAQHVPLNQREREDFATLVDRLHVVLTKMNGERLDAMVMPRQLRIALRVNGLILHHDVDSEGTLITENGLSTELDTMLNYVTHISFQYGAGQEGARGLAARRRAVGSGGQRRRGGCTMM